MSVIVCVIINHNKYLRKTPKITQVEKHSHSLRRLYSIDVLEKK
jgi:hypothetical protein